MKKRLLFISNSSSSSFLIYGAMVSSEDITEETFQKYLKEEYPYCDTLEQLLEEQCYSDLFETIADKLDVDIHNGSFRSYFGLSWDKVGDNETGKQFKEKIQNKLKELGLECNTYEEAFYDG